MSLQGTYYHCKCSNSKSVNILVAAGRKSSFAADELVLRYEDEHGKKSSHRGLLGSIQKFGPLVRREAINIGASTCDGAVKAALQCWK